MTGSDEARLVERTLAGDMRAFEALVRRYQDPVAAFIWRIVPSEMDREEVCQDVFLKAYRNLDHFRFESSLSTWLYSIAWRTAISLVRKKRLEFDPYEDDVAAPRSPGVDDDEISGLLAVAIARLGPEERAIVTLYHVQGCTIEEIAGIIDKPGGTIKSILFRVRKRLKDDLMPLVNELDHPEDILS